MSNNSAEEIKSKIAGTLDINPELLIYNYRSGKNGSVSLELSTISPNRHRTKFLFHTTEGKSESEALAAMLDYVTKHMKDQDTWQIRWHNPHTKTVEVSWFRASDIMEALNKFFHDGKEVAEYKIYEVSLRPYA